ncbi:sugar phosphate isomerase/epimerase family protein [Hominifimenecus sp. rT4P-3]|uniref:sugar phosphate isomerase/epimerase family protein n=1 Tax=Hominifimenecus sp. rT4P-3 TaxID=3242979 RepID=UPI003DA1E377
MKHLYSLVHLTDITSSPPELIHIAAAAGYDAVSLRTIPMGLPGEIPHDITNRKLREETRRACEETGIFINDTENARICDEVDVHGYEPHLEAAADLGIRHILSNIWTVDKGFYTEQFGELCRLAAQYGQDVNVEFVTWASVANLKQAAELLRDVDAPNMGIVVDTLHFYRSRVAPQELEDLPKEWFRFMHLSDTVKEIPEDTESLIHVGREERLYPGEGAIGLKAIIEKLPEDIVRGVEVPHIIRKTEIGFEEHARRALQFTKKHLE